MSPTPRVGVADAQLATNSNSTRQRAVASRCGLASRTTSAAQNHTWATGVYWVLVVMSTLGLGDITFQSDIGRLFSVVVLLSGSIFVLVLLPFMFIQFSSDTESEQRFVTQWDPAKE